MKRFAVAALPLACILLGSAARADDKPGPAGTWKWTTGTGALQMDNVLKLKLDGDKLTGTLTFRGVLEAPVADGAFKDGQVSFTITTEFKGQKTTSKYGGKLDGDTIKGKIERERNGKTESLDWEAKRSAD